jgi:23S rRNA (uracil1939-C5)-methyltransferase
MWPGAGQVIGTANIVGAVTGPRTWGTPAIEVEPGLINGPADFAQASAAGNAALIALTRAALGLPGDRRSLVELYAGHGNFTRTFVTDGWDVIASDITEPRARDGVRFEVGLTQEVLARLTGPVEAVVLDPPRAGAVEALDGIVRLSPGTIVYVSCDPATLARDAVKFVERGYRATDAWPIDLMPQTAHVEVVLRFVRASERSASS